MNKLTTSAALGLTLLAMSVRAVNTTNTWSGAGADNNWATAANWGAAVNTNNAQVLAFNGSTRQNNTNNYTVFKTPDILFQSGGWTLNGNAILLNGGVTNVTGNNTINAPLTLTLASGLNVAAGQLTVNGVISGAFGLTTAGAGGTVALNGVNTFSGPLTIAAGGPNLVITNPAALGTGMISIPKTGAVVSGILQLQTTGTTTVTNPFAGFNSTTGGTTAVPDIENVSGTNTITGNLIVTGQGGNGEVFQSDAGLLTLAGSLSVTNTVSSRGLYLTGAGNGVVSGQITNVAGVVNSGTTLTFPVNKYGNGTWTLLNTNNFTGGLIIYAGTLALGPNGSVSNSSVTMTSGSKFDVSQVSAGTWVLNPGITLSGSGTVTGNVATAVSTGSTLAAGTTSAEGKLYFKNNLSLGGGTVIKFKPSNDPTGVTTASDIYAVSGNLTAQGTNTIVLGTYLNGYIVNGQYPIISFGGTFTGGATNFAVSGFSSGGRGVQNGYIVATATNISLVVTGSTPANLSWRGDGANNYWDVTTSTNWFNNGTSTNDVFYNNDLVTFDDTATNYTVNLNATVTPGAFVVNTTNNYTVNVASGNGVSGAVGLTKLGSGNLYLTGNNAFTGVNNYEGGQVIVGTLATGGVASPLGAAAQSPANQVLNGGTLCYNGGSTGVGFELSVGTNGGAFCVSNATTVVTITNSGGWYSYGNTFTKAGPGTLQFNQQETLTGTNQIVGGVEKIATPAVFSTDVTSPVIANGGALDLDGSSLGVKPVMAGGFGDLSVSPGTTNGAIVNSGAAQLNALQNLTLTGDTALGGTSRWDIRGNPGATLSTGGHPYNLFLVGSAQISLVNVTVDSALAGIDVRSGVLSDQLATTGLGSTAYPLTVENGATFDLYAASVPVTKPIVLQDFSCLSASSGSNVINAPVTLGGSASAYINVATNLVLTVNGSVTGNAGLILTNAGTLILTGTNGFNGTITEQAGHLVLNSALTNSLSGFQIFDGTSIGVLVTGTTNQITTSYLYLGNSVGGVTNSFTGVASTAVAPINVTGNLQLYGPTVINIASGTFAAGQTYPLISYGSMGGSGTLILGSVPFGLNAVVTNTGTNIALYVISAGTADTWVGNLSSNWDTTTLNWKAGGVATLFAAGNVAEFDDTASNSTVIVSGTQSPFGVVFNNNTLNYNVSGGTIGGNGNLLKQGSAAVTLSNANTYSGGTILSAGTLNVGNAAALGAGTVTLSGGALDNATAGALTLSGNLPVVWNGAFIFNGSQSLNVGAGTVTLAGGAAVTVVTNTLTLGGAITDNGLNGGFAVNGNGALTLAAANTYAGVTAIGGGATVNATVAGALPATTTVSFTSATNTVLNLAGTAQTVTNLVFTNPVPATVTVTGGAGSALSVTASTNLQFAPLSAGTNLTVNMAGLSSFTYSNFAGLMAVPAFYSGVSSAAGGTVTLTLAGATNVVDAATLAIANAGGGASTMPTSVLNLGQNNTFNVANLTVANSGSRSQGTLHFAAGLTNPVLTVAGTNGPGSVTTVVIGRHDSYETNDAPVDLFDTTAGTLNAELGTMTIGWSAPTANSAGRGITINAGFKMGAGTLTAPSLTLGQVNSSANTTNYTIRVTGLFSVAGGVATVTNITLVNNNLVPATGTNDTLILNGTVTVTNGGTLDTTIITTGNSNSPAAITAQVLLGGGTVGNISGADLTISNATVVAAATATPNVLNIDGTSVNSTLYSAITGAGGITKSGAGTLTLLGTNTYTGNTVVNAGALVLGTTASLASSNILVGNGAVLNVTAAPVTLVSGQAVGSSSSTGVLDGSVNASAGGLSLAFTPGSAGLTVTNGTLTLAGGTVVTVQPTTAIGVGNYLLVATGTGGSIAGTVPTAVTVAGAGLASGTGASLQITGGQLYLHVVATVQTSPAPQLTNSVTGSTITLSWGSTYTGWRLQVQTNNLSTGVSANPADWGTVIGSTATNLENLTVSNSLPSEFYRLVYP